MIRTSACEQKGVCHEQQTHNLRVKARLQRTRHRAVTPSSLLIRARALKTPL